MADYITVDGGTTNTRLTLVKNGIPTDRVKYSVGARDGKAALCEVLRDGIASLLKGNSQSEADIASVIASGMITSELGLVCLEHTVAPSGISELQSTLFKCDLEEITSIPFAFIRGVKTDTTDLENADMMRGEETEIMGLFRGEGVYVLPGSHSKAVNVDSDGRITSFKTFMTGEMIAALSQNTILKDAVELEGSEADADWLLKGYEYARKNGINEALFKTRVLKNRFGADGKTTYSFFMGAVLSSEIDAILKMNSPRVVLCGKAQLRIPTLELLSRLSESEIISVDDSDAEFASAVGAVRIFEN